MRNPPPKAPVEKKTLPNTKKIGSSVPNEDKEEKDKVKRQRGKKKRLKKIVGKVQGERRSKGERERYQMQGW